MMQKRFKLIYIVAVVLLLYSLFSLSRSYSEYVTLQVRKQQLAESVEQLRQENTYLRSEIAAVESGEAMERLARERLGFVKPNEKIFYFIESTGRTDTEND